MFSLLYREKFLRNSIAEEAIIGSYKWRLTGSQTINLLVMDLILRLDGLFFPLKN